MRCDQRRPQQPLRSIAGASRELLRSLSRSSQSLRARARAKAGTMPPRRFVVKWRVRFASFRFQEEAAFTGDLWGAVQPDNSAGRRGQVSKSAGRQANRSAGQQVGKPAGRQVVIGLNCPPKMACECSFLLKSERCKSGAPFHDEALGGHCAHLCAGANTKTLR